MKKIWKFWDEKYDSFEDYEKKSPKYIMTEYGEQLENNTNKLVSFDVLNFQKPYDQSDKFFVQFYWKIPDQNYSYRVFEVVTDFLKQYPCKLECSLTENKYDCDNEIVLKSIIENEIKNPKVAIALGKILYTFYDKQTIDDLKRDFFLE